MVDQEEDYEPIDESHNEELSDPEYPELDELFSTLTPESATEFQPEYQDG